MSGGYKIASGIYTITNIINNKIYVGSTTSSIKQRWSSHRNQLKTNKHSNSILQRSWNKNGEENFRFEILEECESEFCLGNEQYWINMLNVCDRKYGYNLACVTGNSFGQKRTFLQRINLSIAKQKSGGNKGQTNPMYGKHHTEEMKKRMYLTKYKNNSINTKYIHVWSIYGDYLFNDISIPNISKITDVDKTDIGRILNGKQKFSKKLLFLYSDKFEEYEKVKYKIDNCKGNETKGLRCGGIIYDRFTNKEINFNSVIELSKILKVSPSYARNICISTKGTKQYKVIKYNGKI